MLTMEQLYEREALKKYFYGNSRPWPILLFLAGFFVMSISNDTKVIGIILILAGIGIKLYRIFVSFKGDEVLYDNILSKDIEYIKSRSVTNMGLIEEEFSLIDPIVAFCFANEESVKMAAELTAKKKNILQMIWEAIASIPRLMIGFLLRIFGRNDYISKAVFYEGHDHKVRGSLVNVTVILFTEQQILSYSCNYDIALGIILEENVREVFYRDVDSVNYGDETTHVVRQDGTFIRSESSKLRLSVASGNDIYASMIGETDFLENQVMAAKSLIRSKKESLA